MRVGRYQVFREIARGGMGTVHLGRTVSDLGVGRVVAIKRLHGHVAGDSNFVRMFLDEARLCARIRHPNVVSLLDLVAADDDLTMVLDYVEGETLAKLIEGSRKRGERVPERVVAAVMSAALHGLHAAHEAKSEDGSALGIVHRDFSPQNVLVGADGVARVVDFGVAKAAVRLQTTRDGELKGKLGYMAPEQVAGGEIDRRTDLFAAGVVLWELLVQKRLFSGDSEAQILMKIVRGGTDPPSDHAPGLSAAWDGITERALALAPEQRWASAREMALAIEATFPIAPPSEVGAWVGRVAQEALALRAGWVAEVERAPAGDDGIAASARPGTKADQPTSAGDRPPTDSPEPSAREAQPAGPPVDTQIGTSANAARTGRTRRLGASALVVAAVAGVIGTVALTRSLGRTSAASSGAPTTVELIVSATPSSSGATPEPRIEPSGANAPTLIGSSSASAAPSAPAPTTIGHGPSRAKPSATAPAATGSGGSCRYYDAAEKIWKIRRECYK